MLLRLQLGVVIPSTTATKQTPFGGSALEQPEGVLHTHPPPLHAVSPSTRRDFVEKPLPLAQSEAMQDRIYELLELPFHVLG